MERILMFNLFLIGAILFLTGCESDYGYPGGSRNIQESKKRNVFIREYIVPFNPYNVNDTIQITVTEAWLEKQWLHGKRDGTIIFNDTLYQLCINTDEKSIPGMFNLHWSIGIDNSKYLRTSSKKSLIGDFKNMPGDTIEYEVYNGYYLSDYRDKKIIGKFILIGK